MASTTTSTVTVEAPGDPPTVTFTDRPARDPGPGEARVRVTAVAVTAPEARLAAGRPDRLGRRLGVRLPWVPGWDIAGVVDRTGPGVTGLAVGDRVHGTLGAPGQDGAAALHTVVPASMLAPVPAAIDDDAAAILAGAGTRAWRVLQAAPVGRGDEVLLTHAGTPTGRLLVGIATVGGARVSAVVPGPHASGPVRTAGATTGLADPDAPYAAIVGQVDLVVTAIDDDTPRTEYHPMHQALAAVARGGALVCLETPPPEDAAARRVRTPTVDRRPDATATAAVAAVAAAGDLSVPVDATFAWTDAAAALARVAAAPDDAVVLLAPSG
ncbi:MAG: alcohol dehydrogenase catalytic domain-containing protein [Solirubrobacteraceae bacterium]